MFKLNNFYEEFIPDNDIEIAPKTTITNDQKNELMQLDVINNNNEFKCDDNEYEESVIISEIKLPTYDESGKNALPKLQFQILNKADLGDFHYDKSNYLKEKTIKTHKFHIIKFTPRKNK